MQELIERIWRNSEFHFDSNRILSAWLERETGGAPADLPSLDEATRAMQAAAILACSDRVPHRRMAYRTATSVYELYGSSNLPFEGALRVVLGRLGNFPAMKTRREVEEVQTRLPAVLLTEELAIADLRKVRIGGRTEILTPFQYDLWTKLNQGRRLAIAAPTSAGKSFVLEGFLESLFGDSGPQSVIYIVPTRALITQVSRDLRMGFLSSAADGRAIIEVATVPIDQAFSLPSRAVYVMTQERIQIMLSSHENFAADVIVVDEAHGIADGSRGVLLQSALDELLKRHPTAQILFASPGIQNLDVFGRALRISDIEPLRSDEPTVGQNFLLARVTDPESGSFSLELIRPGSNIMPLREVTLRRRTVTRIEKLSNIAYALGLGASNLVYTNGPADAESVAIELAARLSERIATKRQSELSKLAAEAVHPSYVLVETVKRGVAFHYSNMPTQLRLAIEQGMVEGEIDFLVCTSTLLQGVNLPAKNIFMFRPEKGKYNALRSVDFWNLAGRAGRLGKEFQGNIFLIDYDRWDQRPLGQPKEVTILPAVEKGILSDRGRLLQVMRRSTEPARDTSDLDAVFVRLLGEYRNGDLTATLDRLQRTHSVDVAVTSSIKQALAVAAEWVSLPQHVLQRSPDISAHKQQALYDELNRSIERSPTAFQRVLPRHPNEEGAFESYADALHLCHRIILGLPAKNRFHRFLALVALWWMQGRPLPRIVQNQLRRNPTRDPRLVVRETLELVERDVRYQCVRLFGCYQAILEQVLLDRGLSDLVARLPQVPLFLEVGASDRTMVSLMSLGISRPTATVLAAAAPNRFMDTTDIGMWLALRPEIFDRLSSLAFEEVELALGSTSHIR